MTFWGSLSVLYTNQFEMNFVFDLKKHCLAHCTKRDAHFLKFFVNLGCTGVVNVYFGIKKHLTTNKNKKAGQP